MNKRILLLSCCFFIAGLAKAQSADEKLIRNVMNEQLAAWNAGDISGFMSSYWQSDSLMFIGASGVTYGWQKTKENYLSDYPNTAPMGKLDFTITEIKRLSVLYFFVVGKWSLTRSSGNISGYFTLLFKKVKDKWVIVADHTS